MNQSQSQIISCHPAAFGQRWTSVLTDARIQVVDNLCQLATDNSNQTQNNIFENPTTAVMNETIALLYVDAFGEPGEPNCEYSEMAEAAQQYFPVNVKYLLVQAEEEMDSTKYMTLEEDEQDTELTLGMVTFDYGEAIKQFPGVQVTIDGTSIAILDVFDEEEVEEENEEMFLKMILTRVFSSLSIIGSSYIVYNLSGTRQNRKKIQRSLFNRLLFGLSVADIISSISMLIGNWAMPKRPPGDPDEYVVSQAFWDALWPGASGNDASCTAQGFFIHIGVMGSTFFTTFVAVQTLGLVRYNWTRIQMNKVEKVFFGIAIGQPLITATAAAAAGFFNPTNTGFCWINMNPVFCNEEKERGPLIDAYCEDRVRAKNWFLWHMLFSMAWVYLALAVIAFSMISLYRVVRAQERRVSRSRLTAQDSERQRKILIRGMLYISIYLLIWIPVSLNLLDSEDGEGGEGGGDGDGEDRRMLEEDDSDDEEGGFDFFDIFEFLATIMLPAQGFLNALIYSGILDRCINRVCCCKCCKSSVPVAGAASTHHFDSSRMSAATSSRKFAASSSSDGGGLSSSLRRSVDANSTTIAEEETKEGPKPLKRDAKSVTFDNSTIQSKSEIAESQLDDEK
mmetsp:Transcript_35562/g.86171  ORF Transcript_35562/g.86171 Transcript_35562/m.86171 type:complete len:622 (+) Transcript_35562:45-1910(+)